MVCEVPYQRRPGVERDLGVPYGRPKSDENLAKAIFSNIEIWKQLPYLQNLKTQTYCSSHWGSFNLQL